MKNALTTNRSESASNKRNQALTINGAIVHLHMGKPVTDSLAISREFLRRHDNVLQSLDDLITDGTIGLLEFKETSYNDSQGKKQRMIELTEFGALVAMPFVGGRNSRAGQVRLVNAFMAMSAEPAAQHGDDWADSRRKVATSFQMVCDTLKEVRTDQGKTTLPHHYINESKLINFVLFGRFESVDREGMAQADIDLLDKVETRDIYLIARGRTYGERKAALPAYLQSLRAKSEKIARANWQLGGRSKAKNVLSNKAAQAVANQLNSAGRH